MPQGCGQWTAEWRRDEKPASTAGRLGRRGLLAAGKKRIMVRTYGVAAIPADVAGILESCVWQ